MARLEIPRGSTRYQLQGPGNFGISPQHEEWGKGAVRSVSDFINAWVCDSVNVFTSCISPSQSWPPMPEWMCIYMCVCVRAHMCMCMLCAYVYYICVWACVNSNSVIQFTDLRKNIWPRRLAFETKGESGFLAAIQKIVEDQQPSLATKSTSQGWHLVTSKPFLMWPS